MTKATERMQEAKARVKEAEGTLNPEAFMRKVADELIATVEFVMKEVDNPRSLQDALDIITKDRDPKFDNNPQINRIKQMVVEHFKGRLI